MKFSKFGRATLAAVLSLGVSAIFTACGQNGTNNTIDYVFATNSKDTPGKINAYFADASAGALTQVPSSPFSSGGSDPVALATSPNLKNLYVVNHGLGVAGDSGIVEFSIGANAKLSVAHSYAPVGSLTEPNAVAINSAGTLLFVTYTYQPGFSAARPGPGALVVYPISSNGSLGTPVANGNLSYYPLNTGADVLNPTAVSSITQMPANTTTAGPSFVYVVSQNTTTGLGSISAFGVGTGGALTAVPCSSTSASSAIRPGDGTYNAGTAPNAIAGTPRGLFLYVTDSVNNQLISYTIQSSGQIIPSANGPTRTDIFPDAVTVDPRGNVCLRGQLHRQRHQRLHHQHRDWISYGRRRRRSVCYRHRTDLHLRGACARPLRLHRKFPRQHHLRAHPRAPYGRPEPGAEYTVPRRRPAHLR